MRTLNMFIMFTIPVLQYKYIPEMDEYSRRKLLFPSTQVSSFDIS